jgi:hypothetical protein
LQENTTIPIDKFIETIRIKPRELLQNINVYFVYLYIFPFFINSIILLCIGLFIYNIQKWRPNNFKIVSTAMPIFLYGFIIPGPINKSHYISLYFLAIILIVLFTINQLNKRI